MASSDGAGGGRVVVVVVVVVVTMTLVQALGDQAQRLNFTLCVHRPAPTQYTSMCLPVGDGEWRAAPAAASDDAHGGEVSSG